MNIVETSIENEATAETEAQPKLRVGIQGVPGAFHDIAARHFFGADRVEIVPAHTFRQLVEQVENEAADTGLMAIENTIAGSIIGNYRLLTASKLRAVGEVYLRIVQNLMALPGQRIEDLKEVHSHPIAIAQCDEFFAQYPHIHLVEMEDTALSAQRIAQQQLQGIGAIASSLAATMYGLELLGESIETNKQNFTRFLVLERMESSQTITDADKVSLFFSLSHEVGSLHKVLAALSAHGANLTKIQSAPIEGRPWEYFFFVDFVKEEGADWQFAVEAIRPFTHSLEVLGAYKQGRFFE
ncbi:MAG: ACT domain-containing protein [Bacteroidetes bacterium]|nr:ACT domain-containing protein [Bacteroidota bacterium]